MPCDQSTNKMAVNRMNLLLTPIITFQSVKSILHCNITSMDKMPSFFIDLTNRRNIIFFLAKINATFKMTAWPFLFISIDCLPFEKCFCTKTAALKNVY